MSKHLELANFIIEHVGGKDNIIDMNHCLTRIRFNIKDQDLINQDLLNDKAGIISTAFAGGRFQVIIGNEVGDVYREINALLDRDATDKTDVPSEKKGLVNMFTDTITKIITPTLGVLVAAGLLKGLLALVVALGLVVEASGTYVILDAIGDSLFYFFPIILGYTSAVAFGLDRFIGMIIGATLIYPGVMEAFTSGDVLFELLSNTPFAAQAFGKFLAVPVVFPAMGYASTVVPIILINYFAAKVEKFLKKTIPAIIGFAFVPFLTLIIAVPLGFIIIGPIANLTSNFIEWMTLTLFGISPILTAIVVGLIYQPLVIFGLHWPLILLAITNFTTLGYDYLWPMMFTASFAQTAAVMAIGLKTKNKKEKSMAIPATISGLMCIIEPAIYGFTLPIKKRFAFSAIGATIGGVIITIMDAKMYTLAIGLLGFVGFVNPNGSLRNLYIAIFATIVTMVITFALTYFTFNEEKEKEEIANKIQTKSLLKIYSPIKGTAMPLDEISDKTFASEVLGKSIAVHPLEGAIYAPFDGEVVSLFPSNHAIAFKNDQGIELLIHIGIDTVYLEGNHFKSFVKQGDLVKQGQKLIEFDIEAIEKENFNLDTTIIFTNHSEFDYNIKTLDEIIDKSDIIFDVYV